VPHDGGGKRLHFHGIPEAVNGLTDRVNSCDLHCVCCGAGIGRLSFSAEKRQSPEPSASDNGLTFIFPTSTDNTAEVVSPSIFSARFSSKSM
jgi:hypothetical protein